MQVIGAAVSDVSWFFIELGAVVVGLAVLVLQWYLRS
jgi:hypothetical protein